MDDTKNTMDPEKKIASLLDLMQDGREYASLIKNEIAAENIQEEMQKSLSEIKAVRNKEVICYIGNVVNHSIKGSRSIDQTDDLPFSEMINSIPSGVTEIDIILVTGGGSFAQVAKFVDNLKARNIKKVTFIIPNIAMSAGTIFAMSGNEIIMGPHSYLGPIDPQVPNKDGIYIPAQSILTLIEDIQVRGDEAIKKGSQPLWTDMQLLRNMDVRDVARAKNYTLKIAKMVEDYLIEYKFNEWITHPDGVTLVTPEEKIDRAKQIANTLCDHSTWKVHDIGITREDAWTLCNLEITPVEKHPGLERALRRFWALSYFIFEKTLTLKIYSSGNYFVAKFGTT